MFSFQQCKNIESIYKIASASVNETFNVLLLVTGTHLKAIMSKYFYTLTTAHRNGFKPSQLHRLYFTSVSSPQNSNQALNI